MTTTTQLELGTRVRISSPGLPGDRRFGVIDRVMVSASGNTLYRVTDPHAKTGLGYWMDDELIPTSDGKPRVDPAIVKAGVDLLLAPRRARLEAERG